MHKNLDITRIGLFLAFAFGFSWFTAGLIQKTGGVLGSIPVAPNLTMANLLIMGPYMWTPALAVLLIQLITKEGWDFSSLRTKFNRQWKYILIGWFLPCILSVLGGILYFLIFPNQFDPAFNIYNLINIDSSQSGQLDPWGYVIREIGKIIIIAPLVNSLFTFGEEIGWRGYLLPKLLPLGNRKAVIILGIIWGVWHWPLIFMGYEYGLIYPGSPWLGPVIFPLFTIVIGICLAWLTLRSGSILPAVIGHAAINATTDLMSNFCRGMSFPLFGPSPVGLIGGSAYVIVAGIIWFTDLKRINVNLPSSFDPVLTLNPEPAPISEKI